MKEPWEAWEDSVAKLFNGRKVKASGSLWHSPADVKNDIYLVECKQTEKESYSLRAKLIEKTSDEALFAKKIPVWAIKIQDKELIIFQKEDIDALLNKKPL